MPSRRRGTRARSLDPTDISQPRKRPSLANSTPGISPSARRSSRCRSKTPRPACAARIPKDGSRGWTVAQWKTAIETLEAIAYRVKEAHGLSVVVHHHAGTFVETSEEIDRLLDGTRPEFVNLLLDTGHAVYGGADPVEIATRHGDRVRYVHLKDADRSKLQRVRDTEVSMQDAWKGGIFCALGQGVVDFKGVHQALGRHGYAGWMIVEQDVVPDENGRLNPDPTESARQSRAYVREALGL